MGIMFVGVNRFNLFGTLLCGVCAVFLLLAIGLVIYDGA